MVHDLGRPVFSDGIQRDNLPVRVLEYIHQPVGQRDVFSKRSLKNLVRINQGDGNYFAFTQMQFAAWEAGDQLPDEAAFNLFRNESLQDASFPHQRLVQDRPPRAL